MAGIRNKSLLPTRRAALTLIGAGALATGAIASALAATDNDEVLTESKVLRDPDVPVAGNPDGNISIIEWSDYNCPYCRKLEPELRQVVQDDGKVRLVMKDWPILGPVSVTAARIALAAKYQDKYHPAHDAMMGVSSRLTESRIDDLLAAAGVDMNRLKRESHRPWQGHRCRAQAQ
ncbi:protein-disulfide isomerase [Bradyrhizobium sp. LB7.2]